MSIEFPHAEPWHPTQLRDRTSQAQYARFAREGRRVVCPPCEETATGSLFPVIETDPNHARTRDYD